MPFSSVPPGCCYCYMVHMVFSSRRDSRFVVSKDSMLGGGEGGSAILSQFVAGVFFLFSDAGARTHPTWGAGGGVIKKGFPHRIRVSLNSLKQKMQFLVVDV